MPTVYTNTVRNKMHITSFEDFTKNINIDAILFFKPKHYVSDESTSEFFCIF